VRRPETRYARAGELKIAYQISGEERDIDVVFAPGTASNLDLDLDLFDDTAWIERVSQFSRFIRFDKRGTGLSDRGVVAATLEERTDDIRAVMDAAESERAFIWGNSEGGCMACLFAATYPERTRGLILWGTMPRFLARFSRELELLPFEQAVARITSLPARRARLVDRGELRPGAFADVVLLDLAQLGDRGTYLEPEAPGGIEWVFVNGRPVVSAGVYDPATLPGRALRARTP